MEVLNSYEGPGYVQGAPAAKRKTSAQSIKESHGELMDALRRNGDVALNAADYERTMHLPVGRGRLACDENGEFNKRAARPVYNPQTAPKFPLQVHSTITDGEYRDARNEEELTAFLSSRKWSLKPLEKKKRFTLTAEDQMQNLKAQIEAERAARLSMERQLETSAATPTDSMTQEIEMLKLEREQERAERKALEARLDALLMKITPTQPVVEEDEDKEDEEDETPLTTTRTRGRR